MTTGKPEIEKLLGDLESCETIKNKYSHMFKITSSCQTEEYSQSHKETQTEEQLISIDNIHLTTGNLLWHITS